jgi:hypothetical protein
MKEISRVSPNDESVKFWTGKTLLFFQISVGEKFVESFFYQFSVWGKILESFFSKLVSGKKFWSRFFQEKNPPPSPTCQRFTEKFGAPK